MKFNTYKIIVIAAHIITVLASTVTSFLNTDEKKNNIYSTTYYDGCSQVIHLVTYPDKCDLAASMAFRFLSLYDSLALSASAIAIFSLLGISGIRNVGPDDETYGVSLPSKRNGVPSISPQVINGDSSTPEIQI